MVPPLVMVLVPLRLMVSALFVETVVVKGSVVDSYCYWCAVECNGRGTNSPDAQQLTGGWRNGN